MRANKRNSIALYSQLIGNKEIREIIPPFAYNQFPADHLMLAYIVMLHSGWELDNNIFIWMLGRHWNTDTFLHGNGTLQHHHIF